MIKNNLFSGLMFVLIFIGTAQAGAQSNDRAVDDVQGAIAFIEGLSDETIAIWSDTNMTAQERSSAFRGIFEDATDIELLAKGMLGRHYRSASSDLRKSYMAAMTNYIIFEFDKRMSQIGFKKLAVTGTTPASGKRGHLFVRTEVDREDGAPLLADWRVRKKNGKFQIVNLEIEGINLLITNRELFSSRIKEVGLEGLIQELENEVKES
ncbi:phospholipid-binding protein MlaC [Kordiimonas sp. SCSIO 12610]|uniref:MlaC/ttg2D family ABC transporter substrate-binding protein n=1 Tax=Kordiimonas sp. SCSIO 12610 TaxID=2829597 RepID=UPI00210AE7DA|nr:ABC transporter substrate-binding protein [Kordiimonas sp. SCSIO 12610]UTW54208.1 ABC transporter substrate-binding protein [Kordiimonas sp. SCSIO 12610]